MTHIGQSRSGAAPRQARRQRGQRAYLAGQTAEQAVERLYLATGTVCLARRWRGPGGEIDLVMQDGDVIVFVEVKHARSHDAARRALSEAQMIRIHTAASEFIGTTPQGQLSDVRFDLATVDGAGQARVCKNAFGHF